jgi:hypothetical protein
LQIVLSARIPRANRCGSLPSQAVWYAFLLTALAPLAAAVLAQPDVYVIDVSWRALLLTAVVLLYRNAVDRDVTEGSANESGRAPGAPSGIDEVCGLTARCPYTSRIAIDPTTASASRAAFSAGTSSAMARSYAVDLTRVSCSGVTTRPTAGSSGASADANPKSRRRATVTDASRARHVHATSAGSPPVTST